MAKKQKEMTKAQLVAACRRADAAELAKDRREVEDLVGAMMRKRFRFYAWELEEAKRLVYGAYGRMMLSSKTGA